jgi:predicted nuclease of restriction endonuclease-like RecB superfamily
LPLEALPIRICDGQLISGFLGDADLPWIRALLELAVAHRGATWRELEARLRRPVLDHVPRRRQNLAVSVLRKLLRGRVHAVIPPRQIRRYVFRLAVSGDARAAVLAKAAQGLDVEASLLEAGLFADLPPERLVVVPDALPAPNEIALQANLHLVRSLLARAVEVEIRLRGNARAVLRTARLRGLLCTVRRSHDRVADAVLQLSGPLSLFRRTTIYGRALGSLVPCLAWSDAFDLRATCMIGEREVRLCLKSGDPFLPAEEPRRYDSKLETRLARALMRMAPDWIVVREPEPIRAV